MKGILITPDNHKAIREGRKTQTRRVIILRSKAYKFMREHGYNSIQHDEVIYPDGGGNWIGWDKDSPGLAEFTKKAYPNGEGFKSLYQVGEVVYIKEAWAEPFNRTTDKESETPLYKADIDPSFQKSYDWKSPLFMPEWAARTFIQITGVKAERLQEISLDDIYKEGCPTEEATVFVDPIRGYEIKAEAYEWYHDVWDSINPKYPWAGNWWVWVYTFKKLEDSSKGG